LSHYLVVVVLFTPLPCGVGAVRIRVRLHRLGKNSGFVSGYRFSDTV